MQVKFTQHPTGKYHLGYSEGDTAEIDDDVAAEMIESGYAVSIEVQEEQKPKARKSKKTEE
jgi:endonuclease YncB( thermonuclease family)